MRISKLEVGNLLNKEEIKPLKVCVVFNRVFIPCVVLRVMRANALILTFNNKGEPLRTKKVNLVGELLEYKGDLKLNLVLTKNVNPLSILLNQIVTGGSHEPREDNNVS